VILPTIEQTEAEEIQEAGRLPPGTGRILFVDDEPEITRMAERMLASLGYEAVVVNQSLEALRVFRLHPDGFDLVIADQVMPRMTGMELAKEIVAIRPDTPVLICTGFSESISRQEAAYLGMEEFLMKPIVMRDLAQAIRRALNTEPRSTGEAARGEDSSATGEAGPATGRAG
jgi:DNA-binding NtrC family response regulator